MATTHSAPIDLYAESREGFGEEHDEDTQPPDPRWMRPASNGERDESAIEDCHSGLARVLGW